jgi:hypothetical protein
MAMNVRCHCTTVESLADVPLPSSPSGIVTPRRYPDENQECARHAEAPTADITLHYIETLEGANINVDLFTDHEHGVRAAAGEVEASLRAAGFEAERQDNTAGLADVFEGMGEGLAEWIITAPSGRQMMLQMSYDAADVLFRPRSQASDHGHRPSARP